MYALITEIFSAFTNAGKAAMVFSRWAVQGALQLRRLLLYCLFFGTLPLSVLAQTEIYTWVDEQGQRHYSDQRPEAGRKFRQVELEDSAVNPATAQEGTQRQTTRSSSSAATGKPVQRRSQAAQRRAAAREEQEERCEEYLHKMDQVQEKLRRGYTEPKGNQLRQRRYELSQRYQRECR